MKFQVPTGPSFCWICFCRKLSPHVEEAIQGSLLQNKRSLNQKAIVWEIEYRRIKPDPGDSFSYHTSVCAWIAKKKNLFLIVLFSSQKKNRLLETGFQMICKKCWKFQQLLETVRVCWCLARCKACRFIKPVGDCSTPGDLLTASNILQ